MIIANVFTVFVAHKYFTVFAEEKRNKIFNMVSYILYGLLMIISAVFIDIPIVNLIVSIITVAAIALSYRIELKKALLLTAFYCFILFSGELVASALTGRVFIHPLIKGGYENVFGLYFSKILSYIMVLLLQSRKLYKGSQSPPLLYLSSALLIPSSSIAIAAMIMSIQGVTKMIVLISMSILVMINTLTFILYDRMSVYYENMMETAALKQQNIFYHNQLESMNERVRETRAVKHDIRNHFNMLEEYLKSNKTEEAVNYLKELKESEELLKENYVNTGNFVVDSILNYKLSGVHDLNVKTELEIFVPECINIDTVHLVSILTNLLDNATEALRAMNTSADKILRLRIAYTKGRLIILLQNSYEGDIIYEDGNICSTKTDCELHGLGIENVKKALESYNGLLKINHNRGVFSAQVLIYLS